MSDDVERSTPPWLWAAPETVVAASPDVDAKVDDASITTAAAAAAAADADPALAAARAAASAAKEAAAAKHAAALAKQEAAARAQALADEAVAAAKAAKAAAKSASSSSSAEGPSPPDEDDLAEEAAWESSIKEGWATWRRSGGSDRRARVKAAARRAESAVAVARDGRAQAAAAATRHLSLRNALDGGSGAETAAAETTAAERQRLTFEIHEAAAEEASARRKWESLRAKALAGVRVLEAEIRALGE